MTEAITTRESVWSYPRPPRVEPVVARLQVVHDGQMLADASGGYRVLETSHPPCYYLPQASVDWSRLEVSPTRTFCEFKGTARYWSLHSDNGLIAVVCWAYDDPVASHAAIAGLVSFYAGGVDACYVDGEQVQAQSGRFYGGWITSAIKGPFKGERRNRRLVNFQSNNGRRHEQSDRLRAQPCRTGCGARRERRHKRL
ncbi:DUF427 domain-containing protein [Aquisalimonas sp.]|uniref:DUF427 domain-containing protein n=1 Tax=Aquisalimonas sp. TaxID=1872621 RepID=UPI0034560E29